MQKLFENIYEDMKNQFPACELKSKERFYELFNTSDYKLKTFDFGYILYFRSKFLLVDYVAIFKDFHSKGFGTKIINDFLKLHENCDGCFFEVEKIDENKINTVKRQNFYTKLGCKKLDFKYYFPNDEETLEMDLFYYPLKNTSPKKEEVFEFIKNFFSVIHKDVKCKEKVLENIYLINC